MLSVANAKGTVVPNKDAMAVWNSAYGGKINENPYKTPFNDKQKQLYEGSRTPNYQLVPPYKSDFPITHGGVSDSMSTSFYFRLLLRTNYRFRSLIAKLIHDFYHKNEVNFGTRCVSAQIRRGDRIIHNVNMIEFCKNVTRPITAENPINYCQDASGKVQNCLCKYVFVFVRLLCVFCLLLLSVSYSTFGEMNCYMHSCFIIDCVYCQLHILCCLLVSHQNILLI